MKIATDGIKEVADLMEYFLSGGIRTKSANILKNVGRKDNMNWLDIILIIIIIVALLLAILAFITEEIGLGLGCLIFSGLFILPFIVIDKGSGSTVGVITSVDKNFFGTTAVYVKTSETTQEKYCIEYNDRLENKAKEMVGKEVKISYGERVGLYSTGRCRPAPIEKIEDKNE